VGASSRSAASFFGHFFLLILTKLTARACMRKRRTTAFGLPKCTLRVRSFYSFGILRLGREQLCFLRSGLRTSLTGLDALVSGAPPPLLKKLDLHVRALLFDFPSRFLGGRLCLPETGECSFQVVCHRTFLLFRFLH